MLTPMGRREAVPIGRAGAELARRPAVEAPTVTANESHGPGAATHETGAAITFCRRFEARAESNSDYVA
jgi:hypothetical protein